MKYKLVKNPLYFPMKTKKYPNITNVSLVVIWRNIDTKKNKYLVHKRSSVMKSGKNKLGISGGMIEKSDKTLQQAAIRELLEESQVQFFNKNNLSTKTITKLQSFLFPLESDSANMTFYLIIKSKNEPKYYGPIDFTIKPFLNSSHEIDTKDKHWNSTSITTKFGHAFLSSRQIKKYFKKKPNIWNYSKKSYLYLFSLFE